MGRWNVILVISFEANCRRASDGGPRTGILHQPVLFDGSAGVKTELWTTAKRRAIIKATGRVGEVSAEPDQPSGLSIHRNPRASSAVAATILESVNDLAYGPEGIEFPYATRMNAGFLG